MGNCLISSWNSDYIYLDYIESTGTQWIDSGVACSKTLKVDLNFSITSLTSTDNSIFGGSSQTSNNNRESLYVERLGKLNGSFYFWVDDRGTLYNKYITIDKKHNCVYEAHSTYVDCYLDGELAFDITSKGTFGSRTIYIFGYNDQGTFNYPSKMKLYNLLMWDDGVLIRDFVPVIRKSDGQVGMLDRVNKQFYGNSGTGSFIPSPNSAIRTVNGYRLLNYIESSGTQWLNIMSSGDYWRYKYDFDVNLTDGNGSLMGCGNRDPYYFIIIDGPNVALRSPVGSAAINYNFNTNTKYNVVIDCNTYGLQKLYINGSLEGTCSYSSDTVPDPFYIFGRYVGGIYDQRKAKIYSLKITNQNSEVIRNLVPAERESDHVLGMYDLANDVFYTNAGPGTFISGGYKVTALPRKYIIGKHTALTYLDLMTSDGKNLCDSNSLQLRSTEK